MKRMLFDVFKRQTKEQRLTNLIDKNKLKIHENKRIKAFNRLIEDANRRLEAHDKMEELKNKIDKGNKSHKKSINENWGETYKNRYISF